MSDIIGNPNYFRGYHEAIDAARDQARLMHIVSIPQSYDAACKAITDLRIGRCALSLKWVAEDDSYWVYDPAGTWVYFGRGRFAFDKEEDAVLAVLATS